MLLQIGEDGLVRFAVGRGIGGFSREFAVPVYKIASASLTDDHLLRHIRGTGKPVILSTGMSTYAEIDHAVEVLGKKTCPDARDQHLPG